MRVDVFLRAAGTALLGASVVMTPITPAGATFAGSNGVLAWAAICGVNGQQLWTEPNTTTGATCPGAGSPVYSQTSGLWTWNGKTSINTIASVGTTPSNLYFLTGTGSTGHATPTLEGTATFNGGLFTFTSNNVSAVPLPAAFWLLGSGLAGLVGVGRRRRSAV